MYFYHWFFKDIHVYCLLKQYDFLKKKAKSVLESVRVCWTVGMTEPVRVLNTLACCSIYLLKPQVNPKVYGCRN